MGSTNFYHTKKRWEGAMGFGFLQAQQSHQTKDLPFTKDPRRIVTMKMIQVFHQD
jgi:hypothetical protein